MKPARVTEIGWRELVALPEFGINELKSKIDTGARTSALHAVDIEPYDREGVAWVDFHVLLTGHRQPLLCTARVVDKRPIKNTSGIAERRYVVKTVLVLGRRHWHIEVSLANRESMEFDLILGRSAIRGRHLLVDPGRSFLVGPPTERHGPTTSVRRKKRALTKIESNLLKMK